MTRDMIYIQDKVVTHIVPLKCFPNFKTLSFSYVVLKETLHHQSMWKPDLDYMSKEPYILRESSLYKSGTSTIGRDSVVYIFAN